MSLGLLVGMMGGTTPPLVGPVPVITAPTIVLISTGVCNKGNTIGQTQHRISWSITNPGSPGYTIKIIVTATGHLTFTQPYSASDATTSWVYTPIGAPAGASPFLTNYSVSLEVVRIDGTIMETIAAGTFTGASCS